MSRAVANHYATLGCEPSASFDVVRTQYRKLALQTHPDKQATTSASNDDMSFERVHAAWLVLGDERRRRDYDQQLRAANDMASVRALVGNEVTLAEMDADRDTSTMNSDDAAPASYSYACRCGDRYVVGIEQVLAARRDAIARKDSAVAVDVVVECPSCSLSLGVRVT